MEWADYKAKVKEALEKSKFDVAESTLLQALQWVKDTGGSNERLCLCLDQLAWIYVNIKDLDRAAACYKESLEIKGNILGEQNPIVARACKKLATVVYMQKRYDLAEKYSKDALNIFKQTLGVEHEETQQTLSDLVSLLRKLNRNIEANILQNMGKQPSAAAATEPAQPVQKGYSTSQTFLRIKVCSNCGLPFDGDYCMRCTEGRLQAQQSPLAQSNIHTGEQNIQPMMQNLVEQQLHNENVFQPKPDQQPAPQFQNNQQQQIQQQANQPQQYQQQQNQQSQQGNQPQTTQQQQNENQLPQQQQPFQQPQQDNQLPPQQPENQQPQQIGQGQNKTQYHQQQYQQSDQPPLPPTPQGKPQNVLALLQQQNQQQQVQQSQSHQPNEQQQNQLQTFPNLQQQHQNDLLHALEQHEQSQSQLDQQHGETQNQAVQPNQQQQNQFSEQPSFPNSQGQTGAQQAPSQPWTEQQPSGFTGQSPFPQNPPPPNMPLPAAPPSLPGVPPSLIPVQKADLNLPGAPPSYPLPPSFGDGLSQAPSGQSSGTTGGYQQAQTGQPLGTTGGFQQVQTGQPLGTTGGFPLPNATSLSEMGMPQNLQDGRNLETTGGFQHVQNPDNSGNNQTSSIESSGLQINLDVFSPESLSATGGFMPVVPKDKKDKKDVQNDPWQNPDQSPPSSDQQQ